ncbi:MAG: hypothetical protein ACK45B_06875 [Limisphaerales bacterium]
MKTRKSRRGGVGSANHPDLLVVQLDEGIPLQRRQDGREMRGKKPLQVARPQVARADEQQFSRLPVEQV